MLDGWISHKVVDTGDADLAAFGRLIPRSPQQAICCSDSNAICPVQSPSQKYFPFPVGQITATSSRQPIPNEGRIAIVTDAGWMRWTRQRRARSGVAGRVSRERKGRRADERRFNAFAKTSTGRTWPVEAFG
jgi:hypothetical protein